MDTTKKDISIERFKKIINNLNKHFKLNLDVNSGTVHGLRDIDASTNHVVVKDNNIKESISINGFVIPGGLSIRLENTSSNGTLEDLQLYAIDYILDNIK